jgi:hypothetical protein
VTGMRPDVEGRQRRNIVRAGVSKMIHFCPAEQLSSSRKESASRNFDIYIGIKATFSG